MNKAGLLLVTVLIIFGGVFVFSKSKSPETPVPSPVPETYEYFWGDGCPHCAAVEEFMNSWEGKGSVNIQKYEVWESADNAKIMQVRASTCGIRPSELGVPFLFTPAGECIVGDTPIIEHFKSLDLVNPENGENK